MNDDAHDDATATVTATANATVIEIEIEIQGEKTETNDDADDDGRRVTETVRASVVCVLGRKSVDDETKKETVRAFGRGTATGTNQASSTV